MIRRLYSVCAVVAPLLLTGCNWAQSTLAGHGPAAQRIARLSWFMSILFLVITLVMWALIAWGFTKRRGTLAEHEPITSTGGEIWIAIGGLVVPFIVLTVLFVLGLNLLTDFPIHGMHDGMSASAQEMMKPEIRVTGHMWWWQIDYLNEDVSKQFTTANELHIPAGRPVDIQVVTSDVMHSLWIPALHGKVDLIPGIKNYIRVEASQTGTYEGQCAEFCGAQHAHMRLLAVVQDPDAYSLWLSQQREPASEPTTPEAIAGEHVFLGGPCSMCHSIRGAGAGGSVAPDLTHVASREYIASNSYPNNVAYLEAWITHAQSLKPECLMPNLTQFTGTQLQELVAYLSQLK
jgi:cytochrome c oxidase subunit II